MPSHTADKQAELTQSILDLYESGINNRNFDLVAELFDVDYTEHNPLVASAPGAVANLIDYLKTMPELKIEIKRIFVDGDVVIVHQQAQQAPERPPVAAVDIFRFEGARIAEHWDVMQPIPQDPTNRNGMF